MVFMIMSSKIQVILRFPPKLISNGYSGFPRGVKRRVHEGDHSFPSETEDKKGGAVPHSPVCLHGIVFKQLSTGTTLPLISTVREASVLILLREGYMKYVVEMASGGVMSIACFMTVCTVIQVILRLLLQQLERLQC
jgi:hypothetical protein